MTCELPALVIQRPKSKVSKSTGRDAQCSARPVTIVQVPPRGGPGRPGSRNMTCMKAKGRRAETPTDYNTPLGMRIALDTDKRLESRLGCQSRRQRMSDRRRLSKFRCLVRRDLHVQRSFLVTRSNCARGGSQKPDVPIIFRTLHDSFRTLQVIS